MAIILHITERSRWEAAKAAGEYTAPSLNTEGFIHCSTPQQAVGTANRYFRGQRDLVLLCIDEQQLGAKLKYEPPVRPGAVALATGRQNADDLFPHLYGPLAIAAVVNVVDFPPSTDGTYALPAELRRLI